jgi:tRNA (guanine-N7-)-methyltransferase
VTARPERTLYGRRRGKKLRTGQEALLEGLLPQLLVTVPSPPQKIDLQALLGGARELWLEVGFGAGEHLVWQAEQHRDVRLIGCEPYLNGVAKCLRHIERNGVVNVRLFTDDARLLMAGLPDRSLGRVFVLFPDPWPKTRHHKRRFVQRDTLDQLARLMKPGAELRLATDDPSYLPWMVEHACRHPSFEWLAGRPADWRTRPADWPATRYEHKKIAGRPTFLRLRRL